MKMEEDSWVKGVFSREDILFPLHSANNNQRFNSQLSVEYEYLLLDFCDPINHLKELHKTINFNPIIRLSLWENSSSRLSNDFLISCDDELKTHHCFLYELPSSLSSQLLLSAFECFLVIDVIDSSTALPVVTSSKRLSLRRNDSTIHFHQESLKLIVSDYIDLEVKTSWTLPMRWRIYSSHQRVTSDLLQSLCSSYSNLNYHLISSSVQQSTNIIHLSVEEMTLNQDILDLYGERNLLVALSSSSSTPSIFLGSVLRSEGNWLQSVEFDGISRSNSASTLAANFRIEVFTAFTVAATSSTMPKSLERHFICVGEVSPGTVWGPGLLHIDLCTIVQPVPGSASSGRRIVVGGISVQISLPYPSNLERDIATITDVRRLLNSPSKDKHSLIAALTVICKEVSATPFNPLTIPTNNSWRHYLHSLDNILASLSSIPSLDEEVVDVLHHHSLLLAFLFLANVYFSEWLTTDVAQQILSLSSSQSPSSATLHSDVLQQLHKLCFLLEIVLHCLTSTPLVASYSATDRKKIEALEICDLQYLADVSGEFADILDRQQPHLYHLINTSTYLSEEVQLAGQSQLLLAQLVQIQHRASIALNFAFLPTQKAISGKDQLYKNWLDELQRILPNYLSTSPNAASIAETLLCWLRCSVTLILMPISHISEESDGALMEEILTQLKVVIEGVAGVFEIMEAPLHLLDLLESHVKSIFMTLYLEWLEKKYVILPTLRASCSISHSSTTEHLSKHVIDLIRFYHYLPAGFPGSEEVEQNEEFFPSFHLFLTDLALRPAHDKRPRHHYSHHHTKAHEGALQVTQEELFNEQSSLATVRSYSSTAKVVDFLIFLTRRFSLDRFRDGETSYELKLLKLFSHILFSRHIVTSTTPLAEYTTFKKLLLQHVSKQVTQESPVSSNLLLLLKQTLSIDQSFYRLLIDELTSFEKKRADLTQDLLCFSKIFLQSFRYVNGCATLFYQESQYHENDRRELFEILSDVTIRAVEFLLSFVSRLGIEEGLHEEVALLCYLFEVALFWVREVAGMHFLINVSFPSANEQLALLPLLVNYLQFHPSQSLVRLLYQLLRSTASNLNLAPLTRLPEELKEVVTSFQSQIVTILLDTCISLPTLHRILGTPSSASSSTLQAVSALLEEKQRQHIHCLLHLLTHSLAEENNQDKAFALLLLEECLLQLYADLSPQLSTSLRRNNSAAKWFLYDGVHLARSLCCSIPTKMEVHSGLLQGMWSQSNGVVALLSRISVKDWQFIPQEDSSMSTGEPDMKWREILEEDIVHCTRWCEEMRSRPQLPDPSSASCLSYCSSQNSFLAFSSVLQCLIDLFITVWKGRKQRNPTTPLVLLPSEYDLSSWRDCLQRLLSSGHWEIGLALTQFLLHLIELTCDRQSSWYRLIEIFPGSLSTPIPSATTSSPRADILPHSTPRTQSFNFTFSPMKTSSSSSLKSLISPRPSAQTLNKSKSFKSLPSSTSPPPPELLLRTQSQSQLIRQASPAPPPPQSHSPFKRKDHFRQELQRLISKFKDKIKFDGDQRFPKQYAAVRLLSCVVGNEESMGNWSSETAKHLSVSPQHRDFFHRIELFNSLNYSIDASTEKGNGEEEEELRGETDVRWKETWLLFSFDMTSYARAAEYYTEDSLDALSVNPTSSDKEEDKVISLLSPLALGKIIVEMQNHFPNHRYLSPLYSPEKLFAASHLTPASSSGCKFFQCFPAFPSHLIHQLQEEQFGLFQDSSFLQSQQVNNSEEEHERKQSENQEVAGDIGQGGQRRLQVRDNVDVSGEAKWIEWELIYREFYVYALNSIDINPRSMNSASNPIIRYTLSLPHNSSLSLQRLATSIIRPDSLPSLDKSKIRGSEEKDKVEFTLPAIDYTTLCPMTAPINTGVLSMTYLDTAYEVMLSYLIPLQRSQRLLCHLNELTWTEIHNQPSKTLLHSNTLFFFVFDLLCKLLESPNQHVIGLANIDLLIVRERERFESEWQRVRKLMKRDYMRALQSFEEEKEMPRAEQQRNNKSKVRKRHPPKEPDFTIARTEFEEVHRLSFINKIAVLRQHLMGLIVKIVEEMKKFVESSSQGSKANKFTDKEAREIVQREGRITASALKIVREQRQIDRLGAISAQNAEEGEEAMIKVFDDEESVKYKLIMHIEAHLAALVVGLAR